MEIKITDEIIQRSRRNRECPIYRAIRNVIHRPVIIGATCGTYLTSANNRRFFRLPNEALTFISEWDNNRKVGPITLRIHTSIDVPLEASK